MEIINNCIELRIILKEVAVMPDKNEKGYVLKKNTRRQTRNGKDGVSGFALTEILVSIAILFLIIASFAVLFSNSFVNIFSAGNKSKIQYDIQKIMEEALANNDFTDPDCHTVINYNLDITFTDHLTGLPVNVNALGTKVTVTQKYNDGKGNQHDVSITSFAP